MTPDASLRASLRRMLAERVRQGSTDKDTRFDDDEIDELITASSSIYEAARNGWQRKADMAFDERGGVEKTTTGAEATSYTALKDYAAFCQARADYYAALIPDDPDTTAGSELAYVAEPIFPGVTYDPRATLASLDADFTRADPVA
jgi:hypothetical protein